MPIRTRTLWRVPLYCTAAGFLCYHASAFLTGRFAVVVQPDSAYGVDPVRSLVISAILMAFTVVIGAKAVFSGMTRRELFCSASLWVGIGLILSALQLSLGSTLPAFLRLGFLQEWSRPLSQLVDLLTGTFWPGFVLQLLAPYLFVLFGQREHPRKNS